MTIKDLFAPEMKNTETMGVAHVGKKPEVFRSDLSFDALVLLTDIRALIVNLENQSSNPKLMRLTRERLKKSIQNYELYYNFLAEKFKPLKLDSISTTEYSRALGLPRPGMRINSYISHLARDWSWGTSEVFESIKILKEISPTIGPVDTILTLGAGACRLPYEIHNWLNPKKSVCVDVSPLLLSLARDVVRGTSVEIIDFPTVPKDLHSEAALYFLESPKELESEFEFIIHDVMEWGFQDNSVDIVITPWFIDEIPMPTDLLFARINQILKPGGYWLNIGPLLFKRTNPSHNYSSEEVLHMVEKYGFKIFGKTQATVKHMNHPLTAQARTDQIVAFCAKSEKKIEFENNEEPNLQPEWLNDFDTPIQLEKSIANIQLPLMFSLDLAMKAGEGHSINQLAQLMISRHPMELEQAQYLVATTLEMWIHSNNYKASPTTP